MIRGIEKVAELRKMTVEELYENYDSAAADNALQFAIFDKIMFGSQKEIR
jgi:hypothetical protein